MRSVMFGVFATLLVALLLLVVGCGGRIKHGTVVGRKFEPAHTESSFMMVGDVPIFSDDEIPDRWFILVQDKDGRKQWKSVSKATYDSFKDGSEWHEKE